MIQVVDILRLEHVVGTADEQWVERYAEDLRTNGRRPHLPKNPDFVYSHGITKIHLSRVLEVSYMQIAAQISYEDIIKRSDYGSIFFKSLQTMHEELLDGDCDTLHITENALTTDLGQVLLNAAQKGGVPIIEIPNDLTLGLDLTRGAQ